MNIIYLDTLFLVNFICDYILLLCTARVSGAEIRRLQILGAALIGGIYACLCTLPQGAWLQLKPIQSVCFVLMCVLSFGQERALLRCTVIFLCISAMLGGILSAASFRSFSLLYLPMDLKWTFLVFSAVYTALSLLFRRFPQLRQKEYHRVTVTMQGQTLQFQALRDTGNELYDPITNLPVLICEADLLQPLFPEVSLADEDPYSIFSTLNDPEGRNTKMKLIPYQTISESGILLGFKPDSIQIDGKSEQYIVAFTQKRFSPSAPYQAIY